MPEHNDQKWQDTPGENGDEARQNRISIDDEKMRDQDDTYRTSKDWDKEADTNLQGQDKLDIEHIVSGEDRQDTVDLQSAEMVGKNNWKPGEPDKNPTRPLGRRTEGDISMEAKYRLYDNGRVDASNIYVDVNRGGQVRLWGAVASAEEKAYAEEIVRETPGVSEVKNELQIMQNKPAHTGGPDVQKRPE